MQGIYAQLTGGSHTGAFYIYAFILDLAVGVPYAMHLCLIDWGVSISLLYICIVLDLAVGVAVSKASMLD